MFLSAQHHPCSLNLEPDKVFRRLSVFLTAVLSGSPQLSVGKTRKGHPGPVLLLPNTLGPCVPRLKGPGGVWVWAGEGPGWQGMLEGECHMVPGLQGPR